MSLRILHVLQKAESDAGRSADEVCALSIGQRQFGHAVEIALVGRATKDFDHLGIPVHQLSGGLGKYGYCPKLVPWLKGRAADYDCVIVHGIWDYCGLGTLRALREAGVPYFVFTHGMLDPWNKFHQPVRHLLRWLYWPWGVYPVLRDAHAVFFLCEDERLRAREAFWLYDCHEFVVRFGTPGIRPNDSGRGTNVFLDLHPELQDKRLFTYIADHNPIEGMHLLVDAIDTLTRKEIWKPQKMQLVVAGAKDEATMTVLGRIANNRGVSESVSFIRYTPEKTAHDIICASEAFLRPSSYEICGHRVAEALSAGVPAIMSTGVAMWRDIVNEGAGIADDETSDGVFRALKRWIGLNDEERRIFKSKASICFETHFTQIAAAHTLTSAIYLLVGVHRDSRWDLKPLKPASELS